MFLNQTTVKKAILKTVHRTVSLGYSFECSLISLYTNYFLLVEGEDITMETSQEEIKVRTCEDIVNEIRKEEFGVGIQLSEDGQRLMKVIILILSRTHYLI